MIEKYQIAVKNTVVTYYAEGNSEFNKNIIFLHGWRSNSKVWGKLIQQFSKKYNCFAIDLPGFGNSVEPKEPFTTEDYSEVVIEFINKLKLKNVAAIGHSYGGRVLIDIATKNLYPFNKIVLVDASGIVINDNKTNFVKTIASLTKPIFGQNFMKPIRERIYKILDAEDYLESKKSDFFKYTYQNILKDNYIESLAEIKIDTSIIWGEQDKATSVIMGEIMHDEIKDSNFYVIKNAGHYVFLDQPEEFSTTLKEILKDF